MWYKKTSRNIYVESLRSMSSKILVIKSKSTLKTKASVIELNQIGPQSVDTEFMYRISWGKFAKFKINQLNYRLNLSPEFKPKSSST